MPLEQVTDATLMVGIYGRISRPSEIGSSASPAPDAYIMFVNRALHMRWSSVDLHEPRQGLWGMNDAGQDLSGDSELVTWFQVGVSSPKNDAAPLPISPLIAAAWHTTERLCDIDITALQLLVPVHLAPAAARHIAGGLAWFQVADAATASWCTVDMDTGDTAMTPSRGAAIVEHIRRFHFEPFGLEHGEARAEPSVRTEPRLPVQPWLGSIRSRATVVARVPEWTAEAIGWLAMITAEGCRGAGVSTATSITITRSVDRPEWSTRSTREVGRLRGRGGRGGAERP